MWSSLQGPVSSCSFPKQPPQGNNMCVRTATTPTTSTVLVVYLSTQPGTPDVGKSPETSTRGKNTRTQLWQEHWYYRIMLQNPSFDPFPGLQIGLYQQRMWFRSCVTRHLNFNYLFWVWSSCSEFVCASVNQNALTYIRILKNYYYYLIFSTLSNSIIPCFKIFVVC